MITFAKRLIDFFNSKKSEPRIILIVQFHNEIERMPGFFTNVLPHVDGIIGLNDGSSDGSSEYFSAQPKILKVIEKPIRDPHSWDEPSNRRALIQASHQYRPDWLLALDLDERVENNFRQQVNRCTRIADLIGTPKIAFDLLELWDSTDTYRVDGIWGKKRRTRLFRWSPDHQIAEVAFHGPWTSVFHHYKRKSYQSGLRIYHLGTLTEADRIKRIEKYKRLDPNNQFQSIGYDYLNNKQGLRIKQIERHRHFNFDSIDIKQARKVHVKLCSIILRKLISPEITLSSNSYRSVSQEKIIKRIDACLSLIPRIRKHKKKSSLIISGWPRIGKSTLAIRLCHSIGLDHLSLDEFSSIYERVKDNQTRNFIRESLINGLVKRFPFGMVLEGADMVFDNYYRSQIRPLKSLSLLDSMAHDHHICVCLLGNAEDTIEEKIYSLKTYQLKQNCWTSKSLSWSEDQLPERALEIIEASKYFQSQSNRHIYINIHSNDFFASLVRAEAQIQQQIFNPFNDLAA